MTLFDFFGMLFLILGGTQSLVSCIYIRKTPISYLFLLLGVLFIVAGLWMMLFEGSV